MTRESDLMVPNGEYQKDGETKTRWQRIGSVFVDERNGQTRRKLKIDAIPVGQNWEGWVECFPVRDRDEPSGRASSAPASRSESSHQQEEQDKIPF